ncbi:hypothetical protein Bca101_027563 [Brassica carinata]
MVFIRKPMICFHLKLIAIRLSEEEIHILREVFKIVDNEKSRRVTNKTLKKRS